MAKTFSQIQSNAASQMSNNSEDDLAKATADLRMVASYQQLSANQQSQEIRQLTTGISQLMNEMRQVRVPVGAVGRGAASMGGTIGGMVMGNLRGSASNAGGYMRGVAATPEAMSNIPGHIGFGGIGLGQGLYNSRGFNPNEARSYSFGAYNSALGKSVGANVADYTAGAFSGIAGIGEDMLKGVVGSWLGSAGGAALGSMLGGPVGGVIGGFAGGAAGGMFGGSLLPGPMSYLNKEMSRSTAFAGQAGRNSNNILRGAGGRNRAGTYGLREQADIGNRVGRSTLRDLSYSTDEVTELQEGFSQTGHLWGASSAYQYGQKFDQLLNTHKLVSKTLQLSTQKAIQAMNELDFGMGVGSSSAILGVSASSNLGNMSATEVMSRMSGGAQQARGAGLMAPTGAIAAQGGIDVAGVMMRKDVLSKETFATIGGEEGMRGILQNAQMRFMSGVGGTMMAFGGKGDLDSGFGAVGKGISSSDDLMSFIANRDQRVQDKVSEIGSVGVQIQMAHQLYDMARKISPNAKGKKLKSIMKLLAVQNGLAKNTSEAEALVNSIPSLKQTSEDQIRLKEQARMDLQYDLIAEERGWGNRIKLGLQGAAEAVGLGEAGRDINTFSAKIGQNTENWYQRKVDQYYGVDRLHFGDKAKAAALALSDGGDIFGGPRVARISGEGLSADQREKLGRNLRSGTDSRDTFERLSEEIYRGGSAVQSDRSIREARNHIEWKAAKAMGIDPTQITSRQYADAISIMNENGVMDKDTFSKEIQKVGGTITESGIISNKEMAKFARDFNKTDQSTQPGMGAADQAGKQLFNLFNPFYMPGEAIDFASKFDIKIGGLEFNPAKNFKEIINQFGAEESSIPREMVGTVMSDEDYQAFILALKELENAHNTWKDPNHQSIVAAKAKVEALWSTLKDKGGHVFEMAQASLKTTGIVMTEDGKVDIRGAIDRLGNMRKGVLGKDVSKIKEEFGIIEKSQKHKAYLDYASKGFTKLKMRGLVNDNTGEIASNSSIASMAKARHKEGFSGVKDEKLREALNTTMDRMEGASDDEIAGVIKKTALHHGAYTGSSIAGGDESNVLGGTEVLQLKEFLAVNVTVLQDISEALKKQ